MIYGSEKGGIRGSELSTLKCHFCGATPCAHWSREGKPVCQGCHDALRGQVQQWSTFAPAVVERLWPMHGRMRCMPHLLAELGLVDKGRRYSVRLKSGLEAKKKQIWTMIGKLTIWFYLVLARTFRLTKFEKFLTRISEQRSRRAKKTWRKARWKYATNAKISHQTPKNLGYTARWFFSKMEKNRYQ